MSLSIVDKDGDSAVHCAVRSRQLPIVKLLYGVDKKLHRLENKLGLTPLMLVRTAFECVRTINGRVCLSWFLPGVCIGL